MSELIAEKGIADVTELSHDAFRSMRDFEIKSPPVLFHGGPFKDGKAKRREKREQQRKKKK